MKVLLLGATGLLGRNVLQRLLEEGHSVNAVVRNNSSLVDMERLSLYQDMLAITEGNILEPSCLSAVAAGCDAIVNCAGTTDMSLLHYEDYLPVNVGLTRSILHLLDMLSISTYVHVSTANTIGYGSSESLSDESAPMQRPFSDSYYARSKRDAELLVSAYAASHPDAHLVMLNPGFMIGSYDAKPSSGALLLSAISNFGHPHARRLMPCPSGGKSFVDVRDVARAAVNALSMGKNGERYLLTGKELSLWQFYKMQASLCNYRQRLVKVPDWLLSLLGHLGDMARFCGVHTQLSTRNVRQLMVREYYSNGKACRDLDYSLSPIEDAVLAFFHWRDSR